MSDRLYELLPAVYRRRDAEQGEPLRALLRVMEHELEGVEADVEGLYEDLFVETCGEWVVPYLGDLLGVRNLQPIAGGVFSQRAYVANTLGYRRRKGTAPVIEQLARDVSGWTTRVVEMFERLGTTQHLDHIRLHNLRTQDLRNASQLELLGGPFEDANHTAEVRRIVPERGRYNIPNVALHLWRLQPYSMTRAGARAATEPADERYFFHPLGIDTPLFNRPRTEDTITHLAEEINVPGRLRNRPLYAELEALRQARAEGSPDPSLAYFTAEQPVFEVFVDGGADAVPVEEILICHLDALPSGDWRLPPASKSYTRPDGVAVAMPITVAVDPVLGRLAFPAGVVPDRVEVSWAYGFPGDVGAGPFDRRASVEAEIDRDPDWQIGVRRDPDAALGEVGTLQQAVTEWNALPAGTFGVITLLDNDTYLAPLVTATIPEGSRLMIVGADWPITFDPVSGAPERPPGRLHPVGRRPHVLGDLRFDGIEPAPEGLPGEVVLDGLLVEGSVRVAAGHLGRLALRYCTLGPRATAHLIVSTAGTQLNDRLRVTVEHSVLGSILLGRPVPELVVRDSFVDPDAGDLDEGNGIVAREARVEIARSTVLGTTQVRRIEAENSIFGGRLSALRRQEGCVRFCWLPFTNPPPGVEASRTPRRYRCQPDLALSRATEVLTEDGANPAEIAAERQQILARLRPSFTSRDDGHPALAQLRRATPIEIRSGAEDGSEMGVWSHLAQPQRETNLRAALEDTLRVGLEAGLFFVT